MHQQSKIIDKFINREKKYQLPSIKSEESLATELKGDAKKVIDCIGQNM